MDAALPAADQWERDLSELLGLDGNAAGQAPARPRRSRVWPLAAMLVALVVACLGVLVIWQRSASPMPGRPISVVQTIAARPDTTPTVAIAPSPPPPLPQAGSGSGDAEASPPRQSVPAQKAGRPNTDLALRRNRANVVAAGRHGAWVRPEVGRPVPVPNSTARDVGTPAGDYRRPDDGDRVAVTVRDLPPPPARTATAEPRNGGVAVAPPSPRPRSGTTVRDGKVEAIDAIRLLRRQ